jgi:valyl-tRNA synthetase
MGKAPFHTVYLHGTVRDMNHVKMSKSLGNGIDPLDVVRLYGADALRYTVIAGLGMGTDVMLDPNNLEASFAPGRNFATKLWNIGRFLLSSLGEQRTSTDDGRLKPATRADAWILARLDAAISECEYALGPARPNGGKWTDAQRTAGLRLSEFTEVARRFVWNEMADWYVETTKARIAAGGADGDAARAVLVHVFDRALRLLHPVVPFITEALWQRLPGRVEGEFLATAEWPKVRGADRRRATEFEIAREAVTAIRQVRADYNIPPGKLIDAVLVGTTTTEHTVLKEESALIGRLARATISVAGAPPAGAAAHVLLSDGSQVIVALAGTVDVNKECAKLGDELANLEKQLANLEQRLGNENFTARAKPEVVESERKKLGEWKTRRAQLAAKKKALCGD